MLIPKQNVLPELSFNTHNGHDPLPLMYSPGENKQLNLHLSMKELEKATSHTKATTLSKGQASARLS